MIVPLLALAACGGSNPEHAAKARSAGDDGGASAPEDHAPDSSQRLICPQCAQQAGGETSDFGDNSALVLGGSGYDAAPTACESSEQAFRIDDATARELGFGAVLDRLSTSFDQPLAWGPGQPEADEPATGYAPVTRVRGSLQVTAIEHVVPTLAGCVDSLHVGMATHVETADGALAIEGRLDAKVQRDSVELLVGGSIDLSAAHGTLELAPPPTDRAIVGNVDLAFYLWPDALRMYLGVWIYEPSQVGRDVFDDFYNPLAGFAPGDGCGPERPVTAAQPLLGMNGTSLAAVYSELQAWLADKQPFAASWTSGATTSVSVELGVPLGACESDDGSLSYRVPFALRSADGRVMIQRDASAALRLDQGKWSSGWFEVYPMYDGEPGAEAVKDAATFAAATGISGVDFGELGGGFWHTELYFGQTAPQVTGAVTVEGVDTDGHLTGIPGAIQPTPVDTLSW